MSSFADICTSLQEVEDAITEVQHGSSVVIYSPLTDCNDGDPSDDTYILLHQNHHTRELEEVSQQKGYKFTISDIQLNTSGVYCVYKQCAPEDKEQCCIRISG